MTCVVCQRRAPEVGEVCRPCHLEGQLAGAKDVDWRTALDEACGPLTVDQLDRGEAILRAAAKASGAAAARAEAREMRELAMVLIIRSCPSRSTVITEPCLVDLRGREFAGLVQADRREYTVGPRCDVDLTTAPEAG